VAAPRYDTHPAARRGRQAATAAGTHPTPTRPPGRTDSRCPDSRHPVLNQAASSDAAGRGAGVVLRHGYTFDEIETLARRVARMNAAIGIYDPDDRYEIAFSAIVEKLYTAMTRPGAGYLFKEGRTAVYAAFLTQQRQRGIPFDLPGRPNQAIQFRKYWDDWAARGSTASPERRVIEPIAVEQILPELPPFLRSTLLALAEHGTYQAAADALGLSIKTFRTYVGRARRRFLVLWHEGETPSKQWRVEILDRSNLVRMGLRHKRDTCRCATCTVSRAARAKHAKAEGEAEAVGA
jgi:DNA-directed RNA polymerase specialized sigma24 family protein